MRQLSYIFTPIGNTAQIQAFEAPPFVYPNEFLSVVDQDGKIKLHALADDTQDIIEHQILIVGTGERIPNELVNRLYKVGSVLLSGRFGYHVYRLGESRSGVEAEKTLQFSLHLEWHDEDDITNPDDYDSLNQLVDKYVAAHDPQCELRIYADQEGIVLRFYNAELRHEAEFQNLMLAVCVNTAVKKFNLVIGDEV